MKNKQHKTSVYKSVKIHESAWLIIEEIRLHLIHNKGIHITKSGLLTKMIEHGKKILT